MSEISPNNPINLVGALRNALAGECMAIVNYTNHIRMTNVTQIKNILTEILDDEKDHYRILLDLIRKIDKGQMNAYNEVTKCDCMGKGSVECTSLKTDDFILNLIREDVLGENYGVITYDEIIALTKSEEVKKALTEINEDEKRHIEMLNLIFNKYEVVVTS